MTETIRVGIIGDHEPSKPSHAATDAALAHAAEALDVEVETTWLPTVELEGNGETIRLFDAIWCSPGSPYESLSGALEAIRVAREDGVPFIGTCGGFQHAVLEYARNVLDFSDAAHAEYDERTKDPFISSLSCSLVGEKMTVLLEPGSVAREAYGEPEVEEEYLCSYGLDVDRREIVEDGGLRISGFDRDGEARVLELPDHPFYVATLFVPQMRSSPGDPHPLIVAFLGTAVQVREKGVAG